VTDGDAKAERKVRRTKDVPSFPQADNDGRRTIRELDRTVVNAARILDILLSLKHPALLREIVTPTGLSQTATYRLLSTLESVGLVQRYSSPRGYGLGWKIATLANGLLQHPNNPTMTAFVHAISKTTGLTASVHVLSGYRWVCVASETGRGPLVHHVDVGLSATIALGSAGRAILAFLDEVEAEKALRMVPRSEQGPGAGRALADVWSSLKVIRQSGLAVSVEETTKGVIGMASPIFATGGSVIGCVNVSGPAALPPEDVLRVVADDLRHYGALLSREFGDTTRRAWRDVGPPFEK